MTERRKLVREEAAAPRSARRTREDDEREAGPAGPARGRDEPRAADRDRGERGGRARWTGGRPSLVQDYGDVGRGTFFVGVESAAIALDTVARVLRAAVDRAFDEDYERPGDLVRGVAGEADLAAYDLANELRGVPRRLSRRFDDAVRSPRADRGERERREAARTGRAEPREDANGDGAREDRPLRPRREG